MDESVLKQVHEEATIILARFLDPALAASRMDMARALEPRPEDYAKVFNSAVAEKAQAGYQALWQNPPPWPVRAEQNQLKVAVALAEDFTEDTPRSQYFPGGYRTIAHHLVPGRIWVCWEFVAPAREMGVSFDGLVPLDGHWAWFPKPWKVLPSPNRPAPLGHYSE